MSQTLGEPVPAASSAQPEPAIARQAVSPFAALRFHDFRLLWLGQVVSQMGTQMTSVAITWQLYEITGAAAALGLLGLCRLLPLVLLSLGSGVLADSVDRRRLMLVSQSTMCLLSALLALLTFSGLASAWLIYLIVTLIAAANTFDMPARQALIPSIVPRDYLSNALSLNIIAWQVATIVGPTIGGALLAWRRNADLVYAIDAISFGAVIVALLLMRTRHVRDERRPAVSLGAAIEGLRFVWRTPILFWSMMLDFIATFFAGATTLLPIFAKDILQVGPQGLGLLYASPSVGAVLAGLATAWLGRIRRQGRVLLAAVLVYGLCTVCFGLSRSTLLSCLMLAGVGAADTVSMVIRGTLRQMITPDALRGRMVSVNQLFFAGGPQLGEIEAGLVAQVFGAPVSVWTGGLACMIAVLVIALKVPQLRRYEEPIDERVT